MRTERARSTTPIALAALALTAVTALTACGADDEKAPDAPKTATGTLEQLAEQAECDPNIQTDAKELRQANCATKDGKYVLATFTTDRGQREWINEANDYGGSYLVGRKWVVVGEEKVVTALRGRLGGTVETGSSHGGHSGSSADGGGGHEQEHSGHH